MENLENLFSMVFKIGNYAQGVSTFSMYGWLLIIVFLTALAKWIHSNFADTSSFDRSYWVLWLSMPTRALQFFIPCWIFSLCLFVCSPTVFLIIGILFLIERIASLIAIFARDEFCTYMWSYNSSIRKAFKNFGISINKKFKNAEIINEINKKTYEYRKKAII